MKICLATFVLMASMNYLVQTAPQSKIPSLTDLRMKAASIGYQWAPQFGQKVWREVKTGKLFLEQNNAVRPITLSELKAQKSRSNSASSKAVTAKKDGRRLVTAESSFLMPPDNLPGVEGIMTVPNGAAIRAAINRGASPCLRAKVSSSLIASSFMAAPWFKVPHLWKRALEKIGRRRRTNEKAMFRQNGIRPCKKSASLE